MGGVTGLGRAKTMPGSRPGCRGLEVLKLGIALGRQGVADQDRRGLLHRSGGHEDPSGFGDQQPQ